MSVEAITWALQQPLKHSSAKFVLVAIANCADADRMAWPSLAYLTEATGQDRKTVTANMARLRDLGYLEDTGERKGATKQVIVYRLNQPKNGTIKEDQKRNSTENGTVPFLDRKRPVFPHKEAQISPETGPKTDHGTVKEPSRNRKEPSNTARSKSKPEGIREILLTIPLPDWLPRQSWTDWVDHRIAVKSPMTERAADLALKHLERLRAAGNNPVLVVEQSVRSGKWTDLYPLRDQQQPTGTRAGAPSTAQRRAAWGDALTQTLDDLTSNTPSPETFDAHTGNLV